MINKSKLLLGRAIRIVLCLFTGIALTFSVTSWSAASPRSSPARVPTDQVYAPDGIADAASSRPGVSLTPTQWRAAKLARDARNKAISARGTSMDYRKMKTVFGSKSKMQVDWRRQMAAGYRQAGGKIKHISKAENKAVEKRRKQIYGKKRARGSTAADVRADASPCKGRTGTVVKGSDTWQYLNSCETIDVLYSWGGCVAFMGALGFVAGSEKRVSWPAYAIGAFCGYWVGAIQRAQAKSDTGSIVVRTHKAEAYQPYPGQVRYHIRTTIYPQ